ncbi:hypothetical protein M3685_12675 [Heyndrickxia oleronia]|jgi:protein involved in polysaccharide export with SLBB domain|uniref:Uncharacterized protein n=1 Tax=Heyndrickxia oleronia TaxID=38875 RepID=A0AAW6T2M0_9BACI|nr:hypothetical protein [Heyndrickxia oleronia]NYV66510.1 hypothetical protein [Bacillus sp. Gen3]MCM3240725.1 hypothetical protein [Heyndrickxia oleronia]MCM3454776.1 hypothetical protein [Heyndrickxia oleronia]MDH5163327.1 hypothetical protein [Heyndrickxia oleronia]GIN41545.1 hypothetical protein J19TS1_44940 [Heyndrickxia oleronia]
MKLNLKRAGHPQYRTVDIQIGDKVMVTIWDLGCFTGFVDTVTKDFVSISYVELIEKCDPESIIYSKSPFLFYNEEIYCLVVIEKSEGGAA